MLYSTNSSFDKEMKSDSSKKVDSKGQNLRVKTKMNHEKDTINTSNHNFIIISMHRMISTLFRYNLLHLVNTHGKVYPVHSLYQKRCWSAVLIKKWPKLTNLATFSLQLETTKLLQAAKSMGLTKGTLALNLYCWTYWRSAMRDTSCW